MEGELTRVGKKQVQENRKKKYKKMKKLRKTRNIDLNTFAFRELETVIKSMHENWY